jgi:hypothetical protein
MSLTDIPQDVIKLIYFNYLSEQDIFSLHCTCKLIYDYIIVKKIYYNPAIRGKLYIKMNSSLSRFISSGQKSIVIVGFNYEFVCYSSDAWFKTFKLHVTGNHLVNTEVLIREKNHINKFYNIRIIIN